MSSTVTIPAESLRTEGLGNIVLEAKGDAPLHRQLSTQLRNKIQSDFDDGDVFYTEETLVARLPVSRITVRRALEDLRVEGLLKRQVGRGTTVVKSSRHAAVRKSVGEPLVDARVSDGAVSKLKRIGLFVTGYDSDQMLLVTQQAAEECARHEIEERVYSTHVGTRIQQALERVTSSPSEEAFILYTAANETVGIYQNLTSRGYRTICIDGITGEYVGASVSTNSRAAVRIGLDHLWSLGHEKILLLVNEPMRDTGVSDKVDEFMIAMRERGLASSARFLLCGTQHGESSYDAAYANMPEVWSQSPDQRSTAIFAVSESGGYAAARWLMQNGISVPDDVSVMGFGGASSIRHGHPTVTTIAHNTKEIASRAVELLISGNDLAGIHELVNPTLVIGETTAVAKQ